MVSDPRRAFVQDVLVTSDALQHRLHVLKARHSKLSPELQAAADGVEDLLGRARKAALGIEPRYRRLTNWWKAPLLETAYRYLHAAHVQMVDLFDDADVDSAIPVVSAKLQQELGRDDPRRLKAEQIQALRSARVRRTALRNSLELAYAASDDWHTRQRSFRNIIVIATVGIAVILSAVAVLVFLRPSYMPFCFENVQEAKAAPAAIQPPTTSSSAESVIAVKTTSCPTGEDDKQQPAPFDIVIVALLGLLGGSLAAAISIRNVRGVVTPYDIPVALAILKVPSGALTAIVGLVAIRGNFVPGLSALDSQEQILAYALVLGYAQQLATGFLDRRAQSLAKAPMSDPVVDPVTAPSGPASQASQPETRRDVRPRPRRRLADLLKGRAR